MPIIESNKPIAYSIINIAYLTAVKSSKRIRVNDESIVDVSYIRKRYLDLGKAILNNHYEDMLKSLIENGKRDIKGVIVPTMNSILHLIDYKRFTSKPETVIDLANKNISLLEDATLDKLVNRLVKTIKYIYSINLDIKNIVNEIAKNNKRTLEKMENSSNFKIVPYEEDILLKELINNGHLLQVYGVTPKTLNFETVVEKILDFIESKQDITYNLEIDAFFKEQLKSFHYDPEMLEETLVKVYENIHFKRDNRLFLSYPELINLGISFVIIEEFIRNSGEYNINDSLIETLKTIYDAIIKTINNNRYTLDLIYSNDYPIVYIESRKNEDRIDYYISLYLPALTKHNNINNEAIFGYIANLIGNKEVKIGNPIYHKTIELNLDEYIKLYEDIIATERLENANRARNYLISYYILAFKDVIGEDLDLVRKIETEYLRLLDLAKLNKIDEVVYDIIRLYLFKNIDGGDNYIYFINAMEESEKYIPDNIRTAKTMAGYATYKYILYYLAQQTTIV